MTKLSISQIGQEFLQYQDTLANTYKYKQQPKDVAEENYEKYYNNLPECFKLQKQSNALNEICKAGYSVTFGSMPIISREGTEIASTYDRIVIGQYGAFIEIDDKYINKNNIKVKPGQEYRIRDPKYKDNVKYQWFTTKDTTDCKLYYQQKGVCYADYLPGKWYISPYEVLTDKEIEQYLLEGKQKNFLFGIEEGIICQQVNCCGVMGAGLAKVIMNQYPQVKETFDECYRRTRCDHNYFGKVHPSQLGAFQMISLTKAFNPDTAVNFVYNVPDLYVANIYSQDYYGNAAKTGQIYTKEDKLINCIETIAKTTDLPVYVPIKIGCGFGGGNWESILNKLQHLNLDNLYLLDTFSYEVTKIEPIKEIEDSILENER